MRMQVPRISSLAHVLRRACVAGYGCRWACGGTCRRDRFDGALTRPPLRHEFEGRAVDDDIDRARAAGHLQDAEHRAAARHLKAPMTRDGQWNPSDDDATAALN